MSEAASAKQGNGASKPAAPGPADETAANVIVRDELEELRRLLLSPEQADLAEARRRIDRLERGGVSVEGLAGLLPEAVVWRNRADNQLARALEPTLEESLRGSVQRDPQPFADALFPIFGPAIRKSIREALRSLLDTVNQTADQSLSVRSVRWRIEAWRTGRSFSEVVLRHTLQYRVEQVFLIAPESGLPLQHVAAEAVDTQDSSLVSGMLMGIQDFVEDSFGGDAEDTLDEMRVGDLTVWVEEGPHAMLAVVIRGLPDQALRTVLKDVLETIHLRFKRELERFDGNPEPLGGTRPLLEQALREQFKERERKPAYALWILFMLVLAVLGLWLFSRVRDHLRWQDYLAALEAEPGIVVTATGRDDGSWFVRGLRDPLAEDPQALLAAAALAPGRVHGAWEPYQSLDSAFVVRRAGRLLAAPPAVTFHYDGGTLYAHGTAAPTWIESARRQAPFLAGVVAYDDDGLQDDRVQRYQRLAEAIERRTLRFEDGTRLAAGQQATLEALADEVLQLQAIAQEGGRAMRLQVLGHVSSEGDPAANRFLSRQRADAVREALLRRGLPANLVEAVGTGTTRLEGPERTEADRLANRSASFRIVNDAN